MAWQSMTIYFCEFIRAGVIQHRQGYHQMENLNKARNEWKAKNTKPPAVGIERDEYETSTYAVYVTDVEVNRHAESNPSYPNDGRDGAQMIADAGMNQMGT